MNSKEALCEILKRTDKKESEYTTKCAEIIVKDLEILDLIVENLHWQKAWYQNQAQYGHEEVSFCFSAFWSPDKYNKLKEWVEKNLKKN